MLYCISRLCAYRCRYAWQVASGMQSAKQADAAAAQALVTNPNGSRWDHSFAISYQRLTINAAGDSKLQRHHRRKPLSFAVLITAIAWSNTG